MQFTLSREKYYVRQMVAEFERSERMSRLTRRTIDICGSCDQQEYCRYTPNARNCYLRQLHEKLKHYEDLEDTVGKIFDDATYTIESIVGYFLTNLQLIDGGIEKACALTNEDYDKWKRWVDLEEQGRLIRIVPGNMLIKMNDEAEAKLKELKGESNEL